MHCKAVLNRLERTCAGSAIRQAYITMEILFRAAVNHALIVRHPVNGVRFSRTARAGGKMVRNWRASGTAPDAAQKMTENGLKYQ